MRRNTLKSQISPLENHRYTVKHGICWGIRGICGERSALPRLSPLENHRYTVKRGFAPKRVAFRLSPLENHTYIMPRSARASGRQSLALSLLESDQYVVARTGVRGLIRLSPLENHRYAVAHFQVRLSPLGTVSYTALCGASAPRFAVRFG